MKRLLLTTFSALMMVSAWAQSSTNSPYSMYGLGILADQGNGHTRGMNNTGIAFRDNDQVNILNPASYSAVDSITFLFDAGMSLQKSNMKETYQGKTVSLNANNSTIDYVMGSFRAIKNLGVTFGFVPFSTVGYNFSPSATTIDDITVKSTYKGEGGTHEVFVGAGWQTPLKGLSIGANVGYLWGDISRSITSAFSNTSANSMVKTYDYSIRGIQLELGAQYVYDLNAKDHITLGATYRHNNEISADCSIAYTAAETQTCSTDAGMTMPRRIGVGLGYNHDKKWRIGADYSLEQWSDVNYPKEYNLTNGAGVSQHAYQMEKGLLSDRHKFNIGGEYCQNAQGRSFLSRLRYRAGISYTTPYVKINGNDGPDEIAATIGFGFPVMNAYLNSSKHFPFVNLSAQWVRSSMKNGITDNTFRINIGLTLNERWFAKWQFD